MSASRGAGSPGRGGRGNLAFLYYLLQCITYIGRDVFSDWMYLPDLILEHIFKFLSYKVSW